MRQDDAVRFTLQCLEDVRTRGLSSKSGPSCVDAAATWARVADPSEPITSLGMNEPPSLQSLDPSQRETVLVYLVEQLRAYQEQVRPP